MIAAPHICHPISTISATRAGLILAIFVVKMMQPLVTKNLFRLGDKSSINKFR